MPVPDRPDPDDILASEWGQWVHDRQLAADVQFYARLAAASGVGADNTFVFVPFDTVAVDVGSHWNPATHQWTAPRTGTIEAVASIPTTAAAPAAGTNQAHIGSIFVAGGERRLGQIIAPQVSAFTTAGSIIEPITAGQTIDARAYLTAPGLVKQIGAGATLAIRYVA